jgi:branched-chain amino acid transport system ATP-binding protein
MGTRSDRVEEPASEHSGSMMLVGTQVSKRFGGVVALADVDFCVQSGEIVGLIGPNGSGKTTLFNVISGLYTPDSGSIVLEGHPINGLPPHRIAAMGIGRTFQIVRPLMDSSLCENVATAVLYGREGIRNIKAARRKALEILDFTGLEAKAHQMPSQLALEDRKRLEVARALGSCPKLLLLDEVYAGLNPSEIKAAIELTFRIKEQFGATIFMIEHVMKAIMETCSRVIALHHGVKIADGSPREVTSHREVISAYLGAEYAGD